MGYLINMIRKYLNGWRRLGIVLASVWSFGIALIASFGSDTKVFKLL
jgi:hypothetical protein